MTQYLISNGDIAISFSVIPDDNTRSLMKANGFRWYPKQKYWKAPYSPEREDIVKRIVSTDQDEAMPQKESKPSVDTKLDEAISKYLTEENTDGDVEQIVFNHLTSNPDGVIALINQYKKEASSSEAEKAQYEDLRNALKKITDRKKFVANKKRTLERIVASYLDKNNIDKQKCSEYSLVLTTSKSFSLSKDYVSDLIAGLNLPAWLNVEITLNKSVIDDMETVPDGVNVIETKKCKLQKNLSDTSNEYLEYFNQGLTIKEISEQRGVKWVTVYIHLCNAISKGELDLFDYIDSETLAAIKQYHDDNPTTNSIKEYCNAFSGEVEYDIMALALKYLKIR